MRENQVDNSYTLGHHRPMRFVLTALLTISLSSCGSSESDPVATADDVPAPADGAETPDTSVIEDDGKPTGPFQVTVEGGYGGGVYAVGETVHAFAANDPHSELVVGWSADGLAGPLPAEWHVTFEMPASDVTLSPVVEQVSLELEEKLVNGTTTEKRLFAHVPDGAKGVLFVFHGTQGSANVVHKPAMRYIALLATHLGYAVLSPEAMEVTLGDQNGDGKKRWNAKPDLESNVDLQDIAAYSAKLTSDGLVPADGPRVAIGMSNGGAFAVTVGATLEGFVGVASYCATGRADAYLKTETPTAWLMCENDTNETVGSKKDSWEDGAEALEERGIRTLYDVHPPSPVYPGRFARLKGVDAEMSAAAVAELAEKGWLDDAGFLAKPAAEVIGAVTAEPAEYPQLGSVTKASSPGLVRGELKAAWADHQMFDDWARRTFDFFEAE